MASRPKLPHHVHSNSRLRRSKLVSTLLVAKSVEPNSIAASSDFVAPLDDKASQGKCLFMFVSTRRAWCDDCSAYSGFFVKTLAVGHECPLFSHQHSCRLVSHAHFTGIQIRIQQLVSETRLKHLHFRQLPRLTDSRPFPHEETLCPAIASQVSVRLEPIFVLCSIATDSTTQSGSCL